MVELKLQTDLKQTLELLLSPRLLQMLKVLNLPYLELMEQINKEAEENVMLEVERQDEYLEFLRYITSDRNIKKEADFTELPGLENVTRVEKTLETHLLDQLELEDLDPAHKEIARDLIGSINDQGYLLDYPRLREEIMAKHGVSRPTVDKVLKLVQGLEPEGVGARDLKECLLIQVAAFEFESEELEALLTKAIKSHLKEIEAGDFPVLAGQLGISEAGARELVNYIKNNLTPYPGSAFGHEPRQIIPSFAVEPTAKGFQFVSLETRYGPVMKLSPQYLKMLENPKTDEKTKAFLKEKLTKAKELIENFSKRSETLEKIARKIIDSQGDFLKQGLIWLKPLSQRSLAAEFGLHPSTISRAVAAKYVQTPHGLFPLKLLCPRGPKGVTAARIKSLLVEIVSREDQRAPLTDEQLTAELNKKGVDIDRRTVAFYRKDLKIGTTSERVRGGK